MSAVNLNKSAEGALALGMSGPGGSPLGGISVVLSNSTFFSDVKRLLLSWVCAPSTPLSQNIEQLSPKAAQSPTAASTPSRSSTVTPDSTATTVSVSGSNDSTPPRSETVSPTASTDTATATTAVASLIFSPVRYEGLLEVNELFLPVSTAPAAHTPSQRENVEARSHARADALVVARQSRKVPGGFGSTVTRDPKRELNTNDTSADKRKAAQKKN